MKVHVSCVKCNEDKDESENMQLEGPLYRNFEYKIETQTYKCFKCKNEITVSIYF